MSIAKIFSKETIGTQIVQAIGSENKQTQKRPTPSKTILYPLQGGDIPMLPLFFFLWDTAMMQIVLYQLCSLSDFYIRFSCLLF